MRIWIQASRPKTLISSVAPALTGMLLAAIDGVFTPQVAVATLLCAISLQVLTNLANDYFDHKKGADTVERIGPTRVTSSGLVSLEQMKQAIIINIAICLLLGVYLVVMGGLPILLIGLLSVLFAIAYTAGPYPLAYLGLGDIFAFIFFGPVACFGSYYLQAGVFSSVPVLAGTLYGFLAVCLLDSNNLRDFEQDKKIDKKTIVVRFGLQFGRRLYCFGLSMSLLLIPVLVWFKVLPKLSLITLATVFLIKSMFALVMRESGKGIIPLLVMTAKFYMLYAFLLNLSLLISIFK